MAKEPDVLEDGMPIVELVDEEGHRYNYQEELVLSVDGERYSVLSPCLEDEEEPQDEDEAIIMKIVLDENGEDAYIEPTEEEFARAEKAYDKLVEESEED